MSMDCNYDFEVNKPKLIKYDAKDLIFAMQNEHSASERRANVIQQTIEILQLVDSLKGFDRRSEEFNDSLNKLLGVEKK